MTTENVLGSAEMWGQSGQKFGQGETEAETRLALQEIEAESAMTGSRRTLKQLALSLAISIDKGNTKGRAIANEASQLVAIMQQLQPAEAAEELDATKFTPETQRLLDALSTPPTLDQAPQGDGAGL